MQRSYVPSTSFLSYNKINGWQRFIRYGPNTWTIRPCFILPYFPYVDFLTFLFFFLLHCILKRSLGDKYFLGISSLWQGINDEELYKNIMKQLISIFLLLLLTIFSIAWGEQRKQKGMLMSNQCLKCVRR